MDRHLGVRGWAVAIGVCLAFLAGMVFDRYGVRVVREAIAKPEEPPAEYVNLTNPFAPDDPKALAAGEKIYFTYCWGCHGALGNGEGPGSPDIRPRPFDFTHRARVAKMSDGYWFWRVKEGIPSHLMPSWGKTLKDKEIWQVISYEKTFSKQK